MAGDDGAGIKHPVVGGRYVYDNAYGLGEDEVRKDVWFGIGLWEMTVSWARMVGTKLYRLKKRPGGGLMGGEVILLCDLDWEEIEYSVEIVQSTA